MGAERVHPSAPNRPVKRTARIDISAQAAHERSEALEEAVRRHEYAVEMAASNGDVVVANRSRRAAAHAREGACLPVVVVNPKEDPGNLRMDSVPVVLASVNRSGGAATMPVTVVSAGSVAGRGGDGCSNRDSLANWPGPAILRMVGWRADNETAAASP